jgi:hypothetical protein
LIQVNRKRPLALGIGGAWKWLIQGFYVSIALAVLVLIAAMFLLLSGSRRE